MKKNLATVPGQASQHALDMGDVISIFAKI
jgi:hypothetical protein